MSQQEESRIVEGWRARGQDHLFASWRRRSNEKKKALLNDLDSLKVDLYQHLLQQLQQRLGDTGQHGIEPIAHISEQQWREDEAGGRKGEELLAAGKAAFLTAAGGQGSRLGFEGPKGCFPISPIRDASLFQVFAEKLMAARRRYDRSLYWYIMTSPLNLEQIRLFFESNSYFGLPEEEVLLFSQGLFPTLTEQGKLLLAENGGLFQNPNGHGGTIAALQDSGCLDHMSARGVEELFYFQVDNPLVRIPDPHFLGAHRLQNSQMSSKVIEKTYPEEKLGVIGYVEGKPAVIEYSDLSKEQMQARGEQGNLLYSHGSIAIHLFNIEFLASHGGRLPLHTAQKKIRTWIPDEGSGAVLEREVIKFEMFIFDALATARNPLFFETSREDEFAPLKNRTGRDSIETCRQGMIDLYSRWLQSCGVEVPIRGGRSVHRVEISATFAWDAKSLGESLKHKLPYTVNRIDEDTLLV
jgi:UDP-N-acetylglucosamine/UDP-N-acetylgalactosamine diphosphorylase